MYIPFSSLPSTARIWIYQADKKLTNNQIQIISDGLRAFTDQWTVHGVPMEASFEIREDQFVILAANDKASGCSIDSSVRTLHTVGEKSGVNFFNRNLIAFRKGTEVVVINLPDLKSAHSAGIWGRDTLYFNNLIQSIAELQSAWEIPAAQSWLNRYLEKQTVTD